MGCTADQDLGDESFRQKVYNGVVMDLEDILSHTSSGAYWSLGGLGEFRACNHLFNITTELPVLG